MRKKTFHVVIRYRKPLRRRFLIEYLRGTFPTFDVTNTPFTFSPRSNHWFGKATKKKTHVTRAGSYSYPSLLAEPKRFKMRIDVHVLVLVFELNTPLSFMGHSALI